MKFWTWDMTWIGFDFSRSPSTVSICIQWEITQFWNHQQISFLLHPFNWYGWYIRQWRGVVKSIPAKLHFKLFQWYCLKSIWGLGRRNCNDYYTDAFGFQRCGTGTIHMMEAVFVMRISWETMQNRPAKMHPIANFCPNTFVHLQTR